MRGRSCSRLLFCLVFFFAISLAFAQQNPVPQAAPEAGQSAVTVTVLDHNHHPVTGLKAEDFTLYAGDRQQPISAVTSANEPACIGILVDQSGSMRYRLSAMTAGVAEFVRSGNPDNQVFLVLFNDYSYLDQDFTSDPAKIEHALKRAEARGGTSFYDSLIATADHLAENKACNKRVVLALTDGHDNESRKTQLETFQLLQESGTPLIYSIGVGGGGGMSAQGRRTLEFFGNMSGGAAFFADSSGDIRKAAHRVLEELGSQYRISYKESAMPGSNIKVMVHTPDRKEAAARVNVPTPIVHVAPSPAAHAAAGISPSSSPVAAAVPASPAPPLGSDCISGTVLDEDQKPVARVHVQAMPAFGPDPFSGRPAPYSVTDAKGHFRLAELVKGNYRLYMRPENFSRAERVVYRNEDRTPVASSESCADVTLKFLTRFATLKIHLIDAATRVPIQDYGIMLRNASGETFSFPRFDPETGIRVPPGIELTIQAWIRQPRLRSAPMTLTTPPTETSREITLELDQRSAAR